MRIMARQQQSGTQSAQTTCGSACGCSRHASSLLAGHTFNVCLFLFAVLALALLAALNGLLLSIALLVAVVFILLVGLVKPRLLLRNVCR